jgi:hypothetical protein
MQRKEDLIHQPDQPVLNSSKRFKKLTMILTSVLLLTMFGLGGYWLGARRQQSSITDLITTPKLRWLPTTTPFQQSSSASTIIPSQTDSAYNWKTYEEQGIPFTFQYPPQTEISWDRNSLSVISYSSHPRTRATVTVTPGISFQIQVLESNQNLKELAESSIEKEKSGEYRLHFSLISQVEPININGYAGYKYRYELFGKRERIYFQSPNKQYIVSIVGYTESFEYDAELQPIYNRILSTFKFLTGSGEREPNHRQL